MRADDHAPGRTTDEGQEAEELLRRCARDLMDVADGLREVTARTGAALFAPALAASVRERPRTGLAARWALLRALTGGQGLGGPVGATPHGTGRLLGAARTALGRESLAALVAVGALRLRTAAVLTGHPGYERDPGMRRLTDAVAANKDPEAVRALRALFRDPGAQRALSGLAPLMAELLAVRKLLDEEPRHGRTRRKAPGSRAPATRAAPATGTAQAAATSPPTKTDAVPLTGAGPAAGAVPSTGAVRGADAVPPGNAVTGADAGRPTGAVPAAGGAPATSAGAPPTVPPAADAGRPAGALPAADGAAPSTSPAPSSTSAAPSAGAVPASGATPSTAAFHTPRRDPGDGAAEAVGLTAQERQIVATEGSFLGYLRNIEVLSGDGRILVQNVRGPDGVVRYVVQVPGTAPGRPRHALPQDFAEAWQALFRTDSPHTRSVLLALRDHGIPRGAELALIGHGEGGVALLNLARDPEFCRDHRVTHVIAVGSPPGDSGVADPRTRIVRVTNRHDLVAVPDGRGAVPQPPPGAAPKPQAAATPQPPATTAPRPNPQSHARPRQRPAPQPYVHPRPDPDANPYEVEYAGPTREFPLCHLIREYIEHLRTVVPGVREDVDEALGAYRGPVVRTQAYRLGNRAHPPEGHPFLTVPTASVPTTTGPVDVPVRYYDSSAAHLCFPVDAGAAHALLPDGTWMRPSRLGRRALAVLSLYEHRCSTIGPHAEIALSVLVDDLWRPRPYDIAADLLRRPDLRRTGRCVLSLAVSSEEARVVAREVWGRPAVRTPADAELMTRHLRFKAPEMGLAVEGRLGPGVRCPEPDWVLYGRRGESTVRSVARAHGRSRLHLAARVRLRLNTAAAEPLAGQLRRLHVDTARPLFVLACPQSMVHRSAGVVLPR
ncbi:hypothetical protein [Streptomyces collinus]|uniref:hypothetical protein n=1 Tax=Streptomyces collinus TaxID=42684 RepID=UPI0033299AC0